MSESQFKIPKSHFGITSLMYSVNDYKTQLGSPRNRILPPQVHKIPAHSRPDIGFGKQCNKKRLYFSEWSFYVTGKLTKWLSVITYFSELERVHVVFFEDIVSNPIEEVRRICNFLGISIPNFDERLQCLISSLGGDFKRAKRKLGFDPFTSAMKRNVNLFVKKGREILEKRGLARLPHYERL